MAGTAVINGPITTGHATLTGCMQSNEHWDSLGWNDFLDAMKYHRFSNTVGKIRFHDLACSGDVDFMVPRWVILYWFVLNISL